MAGRNKGWLRERAITALLSEDTVEEAAAKTGIHKRTMLRWLAEPEFRAAFETAKRESLKMATAILTRNSARAARVLAQIFDAGPVPHSGARVAAALGTIRLSLDAFALENIEERLRRLEEKSNAV
jgi:hypothetical protein